MTNIERAERLTAAFRTIHQQLLPQHLMQGESAILENLMERGEGMLPGELSAVMGLSRGRISNAIKNLERKGYLIRTADRKDARQVHIRPTEAGTAYAREQYGRLIDSTVRLLEELGEEDADEFLRIVEKIVCLKEKIT